MQYRDQRVGRDAHIAPWQYRDQVPSNRTDRAGSDAHIITPPKQRTVSVEEAIFILQRQGYPVTPSAT